MRELLIALPLPVITAILFVFFAVVSLGARQVVLRRRDEEGREAASEQAKSLLTGVAATFAFFVGFAISVTWSAVTAGQVAVEQQAAALQRMGWEVNHIDDRPAASALMDKLKVYAKTAAEADPPLLARGNAASLPSIAPLNTLEDAVQDYISGPKVPSWQVSAMTSAASSLSSSSATVAAVANRAVPRPLVMLVLVVGVIASIIMGVTTVVYGRPTLIYVWCLIPALSITVVLALAYPFALRSEANLTPLRAVAQQLQSG